MATSPVAVPRAPLPPVRQALLDRIAEALRELVGRASDEVVRAAYAAPTGSAAIAELLCAPGDDPTSGDDPLAAACAGAALWRHAYASAVPLLRADEAQAALRTPRPNSRSTTRCGPVNNVLINNS